MPRAFNNPQCYERTTDLGTNLRKIFKIHIEGDPTVTPVITRVTPYSQSSYLYFRFVDL